MKREGICAVERLMIFPKVKNKVRTFDLRRRRKRIKFAALLENEEAIRTGQRGDIHRVLENELGEKTLDGIGRGGIRRTNHAVGSPWSARCSQKARTVETNQNRQSQDLGQVGRVTPRLS